MEVAKRHFTERGFQGTRLDNIAAEAGCAKGAIYLEFDDKETLLREVLEQTFSGLTERFALEVVALASPLVRLRETLRFAYRQHQAEPLFGRLLRDDPELRILRGNGEAWKAAATERIAMLTRWVDEGIENGEIRPDVDRDAVPAMLGALRLVPQHLTLVTAHGPVAGDRVLDALVDLFEAGLASARPPSSPRAGTGRKRSHARPPGRTKTVV